MFKFLGKMIKWAIITIVVIVVGMLVWAVTDPEGSGWNESSLNADIKICIADHGEPNCDAEGNTTAEYKVKQEEKMAAYEKAKKAQEVYDAKQKAEASRIDDKLTAGRLMCKNSVRKLAKYPTKVDYEGWTEGNIVENFTKDSQHPDRFWINFEGEWMNGFGNMVPFTAHCKLDMNSTTGKIIDIWIR